MVAPNTRLKGIDQIGEVLLNEELQHNLVEFFRWGLLNVGNFFNIARPTISGFGQDKSRLRLVDDPNYMDGQVWEAYRQDWVWESGLNYNYQPIQVSGVYVDNAFHPLNSVGAFAHHINYPLGRIVFNSPISTSSLVQAEYSHTWVHFSTADVPYFRELMFNSFRSDKSDFLASASGMWAVLSENRAQLPCVIVETVPTRRMRGLQLGGGQIVNQDTLFHIFTEDAWMRNKLVDIITYQNEKTILMFDRNLIASANAYPLDYRGSIASGNIPYPDMVLPTGDGGFAKRKMIFSNMTVETIESPQPLFRGVVRGSMEVCIPEI